MSKKNNCRFGQIAKVMNMALARFLHSKGGNVACAIIYLDAHKILNFKEV